LEKKVDISLVTPFYNEEESITLFFKEIVPVLTETGKTFEIICVNDGSRDATLEKLLLAKKTIPQIRIINLSRNFGKEAALTAGLDHSTGEVVIPIDADLQDPPELINEFLKKWQEGYDVVVGKRTDRSTDTFLKRFTARIFYKLHNKISDIEMPANVGDCRLMTRKVVESLKELPENQRFMKGIFSWVGFKTATVEYKRKKRIAGKTAFNGWKLWNLGIDGVTGFSTVPLRIWLYIGILISLTSFLYASFIIVRTLILGIDVPGYASLLTFVLFLGGIQLIGIGVIGEYVGRIYMESKRRPPYIVDREY